MSSSEQFIIRATSASLAFAYRRNEEQEVDYESYEMKRGVSLAMHLRDAFQKSPLLTHAPAEVALLVDTPVLLVPADDYNKQSVEQYRYVYPDAPSAVVRSTLLPSLQTMALFAIEKDCAMVLADHFATVHIEPLMARLWDYLLRRDEGASHKTMYVYAYDDKIAVCAFHRRRFVFDNTFNVDNAPDAAYFILGAWKQVNLRGDKDHLLLCGSWRDGEEVTKELQQYLQHVSTMKMSTEFSSSAIAQAKDLPLDLLLQLIKPA